MFKGKKLYGILGLLILIVLGVIYMDNMSDDFNEYSDNSKKPSIFANNNIYWYDDIITVEDFENLEQSNLSIIGTTKLVENTPENHGEAHGIYNDLDIVYDNSTDTIYIFYEMNQPANTFEEGYLSFRIID